MIFVTGCGIKNEITIKNPEIKKQEVELLEPENGFELPEEEFNQDESVKSDASSKIIVIDPGHGKSSALMSDEEMVSSGWKNVSGKGWGEWRHFKSGTMWQDCEGSGCLKRAPQNGSCWYSISAGDRDTEPELNYNNAVNAKKYLESRGYTVRLTRGADENPSFSERLKYCYPDKDATKAPDADVFVCLHSNAGGGSGSCYISLSGAYDQSGIPQNYIDEGNRLGQYINDAICSETSMPMYGSGVYTGYPELVLFFKSPVPVGYMEIGFYDNESDLNILQTESDKIGKAIANGIDNYFNN